MFILKDRLSIEDENTGNGQICPFICSLWLISLEDYTKVISSRKEAIDDNWDAVKSGIELDASQFSQDALAGIESFSHLKLFF